MFKFNKNVSYVILALGLGVLSTSCKKDEEQVNPVNTSGYLLGFRAQNGAATSSDGDADYILTSADLMSGSVSATGNGIEQTGWCYYQNVGSTYFSINYDLNECIGYGISEGVVSQKGKLLFERMDLLASGDDKTMIAIGAPWGGGSYDCQLQLVDADAIAISKNVKHPIYVSYDSSGTQLNAWPTGAYVENGKLFVSFYPLNGVSWATPNTDTAYVSVYSYPALEYLKTFKDARTGPIGYYGGSPAIIKDESGNHYTISNTSLNAGYTKTTKNSAILKINAGEDTFDTSYFFDVETVSGYELLTAAYVGNGLAVGRVVANENADEGAWSTFSYSGLQPCKMVVLDLVNKTVKDVEGVPAHGGQYETPFLVEDGKVYVSINTGTEAYVYQINAATAVGTKGAKIEGREIQAFYKY